MSNIRDSEAISAYISDLQNLVRAPSPALSTIIRVLAEPLSFLGFLSTQNKSASARATLDSLPSWSGPVEPTTSRRAYFIQHLLPNHLEFILDNITVDWLSALPSAEQTALFDTYFIPALATSVTNVTNSWDPLAALMAMMSLQTLIGRINQRFSENHSFLNKVILRLLKRLLLEYSLLDYFKACYQIGSGAGSGYSFQQPAAVAASQATWDSFLSKLFSIPTRISNAFGASIQSSSNSTDRADMEMCFQETFFFKQETAQLQECVRMMSNLEADERILYAKAFGVVITKLLRLGFGRKSYLQQPYSLWLVESSEHTSNHLSSSFFIATIGVLVESVVTSLWGKDLPAHTLGWKLALTASTSTTAQTFLTALADYLNRNQLESHRLSPSAAENTEKDTQREVHKAAYLLLSLGYGPEEENNSMIEEILFQGRVYGTGVLRALICIQSGWPTSVKSNKGKATMLLLSSERVLPYVSMASRK